MAKRREAGEKAGREGGGRAPPALERPGPSFFSDLCRILSTPRPGETLRELSALGLLAPVLPEVAALVGVEQPAKTHACDAFAHTMRVVDAARSDPAIENPGDIELMLAALFHDVGKARTKGYDTGRRRTTFHRHQILSASLTRRRLKVLDAAGAGVDPERVAKLVRHHMFDLHLDFSQKALRRFIARVGEDLVFKLLDLRIADKRGGARPDKIQAIVEFRRRIRQEAERVDPFGLKDLAVDGFDVLSAGVPEGPEVGKVLRALLDMVLERSELNERDTLLGMIPAILRGAGR